MPNNAIDIVVKDYTLVRYDTVARAKDAFLDCYFGDGAFDRGHSARLAGVALSEVEGWFSSPLFFSKIETRLQSGSLRRSSLQEAMLAQTHNIVEGDITDLFEQTPSGNLIVRNIKTLPRSITSAIKQMDIVRHATPGQPGEYTECLRIVMHDKTKVLNIIADYTDVKNTVLRTSSSGAPQMVGISLTTAMPKKEQTNGESGQSIDTYGEVLRDPATDGHASEGGDS